MFNNTGKNEVNNLINNLPQSPQVNLTAELLSDKPICVRNYLMKSGIIDKPIIKKVWMKQTGFMKTTPDQSWMPFTSEQYFTMVRPGFVWLADVKAAPILHLKAIDKFRNGEGSMLIKLLSIFKIADAKGPEINQSAALRFMAEMMWIPSSFIQPYIKWEEIDSLSARAYFSYGKEVVSGIYYFNNEYDITEFKALRYMEKDGKVSLEEWAPKIVEYQVIDGIRIPTEIEVYWNLKTGPFLWLKMKVTDYRAE